MNMEVFKILKTVSKDDFLMIKGPIIMLIIFFIVGAFFFPKPSKIYKEGLLRSCTCIGLKATPRITKGSKIGDVYCLGIPIKCTKEKIFNTN